MQICVHLALMNSTSFQTKNKKEKLNLDVAAVTKMNT